jgi:methionyl-tRNA synthetase
MTENVLIAVAWPYANADIHVGNPEGSYLPADICARYHRMRGRNVLWFSGSDSHGTPITVKADALGTTPLEVLSRQSCQIPGLVPEDGSDVDLFTSTHTENHFQVSQISLHHAKGERFSVHRAGKTVVFHCQQRFLPDRYVEWHLLYLRNPDARSDQCEKCGHMLEPELLQNPRSKVDGSTPVLKETEHFYLDLSSLEPEIVAFLKAREFVLASQVIRQSWDKILTMAFKGRRLPATWTGVFLCRWKAGRVKCLYVWFEAVIGYLSASIEWARLSGNESAWRDWWVNPQAKTFYYIGKDNIPFHAVIWPAELIGFRDGIDKAYGAKEPRALVLPYDIPANEFMNLEGRKISGSKNWAVWGLDFLERYDPDPLRYYLTTANARNQGY